ncbi:MAG: hypothetical protein C5B49_16520 [Bdellovibrio sp.]|nr:MAG: hypothetical protein C5B49_16520 [Bdellovibrio sp.]
MNTLPTSYVLYSHFFFFEKQDFETFVKSAESQTVELKGLEVLRRYLPELRRLLTAPGSEGYLVIYYACGLKQFLEGVQKGMRSREMPDKYPELRFAKAFSERFNRLLVSAQLGERIRFITSLDLGVVLDRVNVPSAEALQHFVLGDKPDMRYDIPKIPEAILRLRLLGSGAPVFRVDQDVIFREDDQRLDETGLFSAVGSCLKAYEGRLRDTNVSTFVFSASYNTRVLTELQPKTERFAAWGWAFATRMHPALVVRLDEIERICKLEKKSEKDAAWSTYVESALNDKLICQWYGLNESRFRKRELQVDFLKGLVEVGAHPTTSVISGAFLCLSDGAILDLPPFSNFRRNVMWIDDHLKYSLHREMQHFTSDKLDLRPGLSYSRLDAAMVTKARPNVVDLPAYVFASYLPTLLWGTIMDDWIAPNPVLKFRLEDVKDKTSWKEAQTRLGTGLLPQAMLRALREGRFTQEDQLRGSLMERAVKRIQKVRELWSSLRDGSERTFASYWAAGEVAKSFPQGCFSDAHDRRLWSGIAPGREVKDVLSRTADLGDLLDPVLDLVTDAVDYIKWTLVWPQFVQIVRSVRQGEFAGDISWQPRRGNAK